MKISAKAAVAALLISILFLPVDLIPVAMLDQARQL